MYKLSDWIWIVKVVNKNPALESGVVEKN